MAGSLPAVIFDAHVHCWDPDARHHAWLDSQPSLRRRFGPEDYESGAHEVGGMLFIQADCDDSEAPDETRWAAGLAERDPRLAAVVAFAPIQLGERARQAVEAVAAEPKVVGVRRLLQDEPLALLLDRTLAEGVRLLAPHRLPFDLCVRHHQLSAAAALVAACPEVVFVLDHLGKPPVAAGELDHWRGDLRRLASSGRVACKLSGLATEAAPGWRPADLRPYLDHALDVFGPDRCMVGSDWPVCTLATTVEAWFEIVLEALAGLSSVERAAVVGGTATSVYGLATTA